MTRDEGRGGRGVPLEMAPIMHGEVRYSCYKKGGPSTEKTKDVPSGQKLAGDWERVALLSRETLGTVRSIPSGTKFSGNQEGVGVGRRRYRVRRAIERERTVETGSPGSTSHLRARALDPESLPAVRL